MLRSSEVSNEKHSTLLPVVSPKMSTVGCTERVFFLTGLFALSLSSSRGKPLDLFTISHSSYVTQQHNTLANATGLD